MEVLENQNYQSSVYRRILIEENLSKKFSAYCEKRPVNILCFYQNLINEYPEDVARLFIVQIKDAAATADNRKVYMDVCKQIKTFKNAWGAESAYSIIEYLRTVHIRRPAFLGELRKIK